MWASRLSLPSYTGPAGSYTLPLLGLLDHSHHNNPSLAKFQSWTLFVGKISPASWPCLVGIIMWGWQGESGWSWYGLARVWDILHASDNWAHCFTLNYLNSKFSCWSLLYILLDICQHILHEVQDQGDGVGRFKLEEIYLIILGHNFHGITTLVKN